MLTGEALAHCITLHQYAMQCQSVVHLLLIRIACQTLFTFSAYTPPSPSCSSFQYLVSPCHGDLQALHTVVLHELTTDTK